jgi:hypothetical protein
MGPSFVSEAHYATNLSEDAQYNFLLGREIAVVGDRLQFVERRRHVKKSKCKSSRNGLPNTECICTRDPAPPSGSASSPFGEELDAIVLKTMRKETQERYTSAKAPLVL